MSFIKLHGAILQRSLHLTKVQQIGFRNKHVIAFASNNSDRYGKNDVKTHKSMLRTGVLLPLRGSGRHFSLSAINRNATLAASVEATKATTQSTLPIIPESPVISQIVDSPIISTIPNVTAPISSVPDAPIIPPTAEEFVVSLNALGEPTLASIGLGGYSPIGLLQNSLEFLHVTTGLPWWGTIAITTVLIRTLMTPVVIIAQRNAAKMANITPKITEYNEQISEAKQLGDAHGVTMGQQNLNLLMKRADCSPMKSMAVMMVSAPVFISYFLGLRRMVNAPVEAFQSGGLLWFIDLTSKDPYFILPAATAISMYLTLRLGTETGVQSSTTQGITSIIMKVLPFALFPMVMNFPAAITMYWACSNSVSLIQGTIFRIPKVRTFLGIPQILKHTSKVPKVKKSFIQQIKDGWKDIRQAGSKKDPRSIDRANFERAGTSPLTRTYKYDPTKIKRETS